MVNPQSVETVLGKAIKTRPLTLTKVKPRGKADRKFQAFTVSQLLETYRDPRAVLLEIAGMDTHKLAEMVGCTAMEALGERRLCAQAVLPYVSQKLPVQVDMRHTRAIHLNFLDKDEYRQLEAIAATEPQSVEATIVQVISEHDEEPTIAIAEHHGADDQSADAGGETDVRPTASTQRPE